MQFSDHIEKLGTLEGKTYYIVHSADRKGGIFIASNPLGICDLADLEETPLEARTPGKKAVGLLYAFEGYRVGANGQLIPAELAVEIGWEYTPNGDPTQAEAILTQWLDSPSQPLEAITLNKQHSRINIR